MDATGSTVASGDLTSTMENVLSNSGQEKESDKNESVSVGDSVPSSSSDANIPTTVAKSTQDDPISSTSDTPNSTELNLSNISVSEINNIIGVATGEGTNASELVTDTDFFSSDLSIASITTERISENVEDIATDLENLLGGHEYSISSNSDKSDSIFTTESQNYDSKKDITATSRGGTVQSTATSSSGTQVFIDTTQVEAEYKGIVGITFYQVSTANDTETSADISSLNTVNTETKERIASLIPEENDEIKKTDSSKLGKTIFESIIDTSSENKIEKPDKQTENEKKSLLFTKEDSLPAEEGDESGKAADNTKGSTSYTEQLGNILRSTDCEVSQNKSVSANQSLLQQGTDISERTDACLTADGNSHAKPTEIVAISQPDMQNKEETLFFVKTTESTGQLIERQEFEAEEKTSINLITENKNVSDIEAIGKSQDLHDLCKSLCESTDDTTESMKASKLTSPEVLHNRSENLNEDLLKDTKEKYDKKKTENLVEETLLVSATHDSENIQTNSGVEEHIEEKEFIRNEEMPIEENVEGKKTNKNENVENLNEESALDTKIQECSQVEGSGNSAGVSKNDETENLKMDSEQEGDAAKTTNEEKQDLQLIDSEIIHDKSDLHEETVPKGAKNEEMERTQEREKVETKDLKNKSVLDKETTKKLGDTENLNTDNMLVIENHEFKNLQSKPDLHTDIQVTDVDDGKLSVTKNLQGEVIDNNGTDEGNNKPNVSECLSEVTEHIDSKNKQEVMDVVEDTDQKMEKQEIKEIIEYTNIENEKNDFSEDTDVKNETQDIEDLNISDCEQQVAQHTYNKNEEEIVLEETITKTKSQEMKDEEGDIKEVMGDSATKDQQVKDTITKTTNQEMVDEQGEIQEVIGDSATKIEDEVGEDLKVESIPVLKEQVDTLLTKRECLKEKIIEGLTEEINFSEKNTDKKIDDKQPQAVIADKLKIETIVNDQEIDDASCVKVTQEIVSGRDDLDFTENIPTKETDKTESTPTEEQTQEDSIPTEETDITESIPTEEQTHEDSILNSNRQSSSSDSSQQKIIALNTQDCVQDNLLMEKDESKGSSTVNKDKVEPVIQSLQNDSDGQLHVAEVTNSTLVNLELEKTSDVIENLTEQTEKIISTTEEISHESLPLISEEISKTVVEECIGVNDVLLKKQASCENNRTVDLHNSEENKVPEDEIDSGEKRTDITDEYTPPEDIKSFEVQSNVIEQESVDLKDNIEVAVSLKDNVEAVDLKDNVEGVERIHEADSFVHQDQLNQEANDGKEHPISEELQAKEVTGVDKSTVDMEVCTLMETDVETKEAVDNIVLIASVAQEMIHPEQMSRIRLVSPELKPALINKLEGLQVREEIKFAVPDALGPEMCEREGQGSQMTDFIEESQQLNAEADDKTTSNILQDQLQDILSEVADARVSTSDELKPNNTVGDAAGTFLTQKEEINMEEVTQMEYNQTEELKTEYDVGNDNKTQTIHSTYIAQDIAQLKKEVQVDIQPVVEEKQNLQESSVVESITNIDADRTEIEEQKMLDELKVQQSLEESVEAICALSKEEVSTQQCKDIDIAEQEIDNSGVCGHTDSIQAVSTLNQEDMITEENIETNTPEQDTAKLKLNDEVKLVEAVSAASEVEKTEQPCENLDTFKQETGEPSEQKEIAKMEFCTEQLDGNTLRDVSVVQVSDKISTDVHANILSVTEEEPEKDITISDNIISKVAAVLEISQEVTTQSQNNEIIEHPEKAVKIDTILEKDATIKVFPTDNQQMSSLVQERQLTTDSVEQEIEDNKPLQAEIEQLAEQELLSDLVEGSCTSEMKEVTDLDNLASEVVATIQESMNEQGGNIPELNLDDIKQTDLTNLVQVADEGASIDTSELNIEDLLQSDIDEQNKIEMQYIVTDEQDDSVDQTETNVDAQISQVTIEELCDQSSEEQNAAGKEACNKENIESGIVEYPQEVSDKSIDPELIQIHDISSQREEQDILQSKKACVNISAHIKPLLIKVDETSTSSDVTSATSQSDIILGQERKEGTSKYSSKMSDNQDLKMTITKHRVEDTSCKPKADDTSAKMKSDDPFILKMCDQKEALRDNEKLQGQENVPKLKIKSIVKSQSNLISTSRQNVEEAEPVVPKITIKPIIERPMSELQHSPKLFMKNMSPNQPASPKVSQKVQKADVSTPLKLTIKPIIKPDELQQQKSSPKLTIKPVIKPEDEIEGMSDRLAHSPKITIKPIIKPVDEDASHTPKITIKPIVKPSEQEAEMASDQTMHSPKITIKPIVKPVEEGICHSPKITIKPVVKPSQDIMKSTNKSDEGLSELQSHSPKITIKPVVKPAQEESAKSDEDITGTQTHSPKITIKPVLKPAQQDATKSANKFDEGISETLSHSPKITIKPIIKPTEQDSTNSPKITIKPVIKPGEDGLKHAKAEEETVIDSSVHNPKITIKPIFKPVEEHSSPRKMTAKAKSLEQESSAETSHSPKITIKPIVKSAEEQKQESIMRKLLEQDNITVETSHSPKITIKPIVKSSDDHRSSKSEHEDASPSPRITIKPVLKPADDQKLSKEEILLKRHEQKLSRESSPVKKFEDVRSLEMHSSKLTIKAIGKHVDEQKLMKQDSAGSSPKITIKPIVKPQSSDAVELIDFEDQIKQERIVLKINKNPRSRKREATEDIEKLAKIKLKFSKEGGRAHIVPGQGKLKRALEGSQDSELKRTKFESGDLTITPINPYSRKEKNEGSTSGETNEPTSTTTISSASIVFDDPLENIPVFEITPESAAIMKNAPSTLAVATQPIPPAPRKRGRPRKVPLVVREEFKDIKEEEQQPPPPEDSASGRPKRSCRGPSVRTTLGIRTRRPRGSGRGRGRGRGSRGGGRRGSRQQRISGAKLKLLQEEAAAAIAEETKRLHSEIDIKDELLENVAPGNNSDLHLIEEETRMSADINSSRTQTPIKQELTSAPGDVEDTQSSVQSTATTESVKTRKSIKVEVHQEPEGEVISADQLAEYYWGGGGPYMLQEQVAQFLGIKSFKRKYPGIHRRPVEMQERDFIRESGLASEAMCDLGLTAVNSADILDILYSDFQHKYEEYCKHQRDRQAKDFTNKQKALSLAASQEKTKLDITQQAVQSAATWNASFNKARKEERKACMDLQTFTVHYPKGRVKTIDKPKVGHYPVALVPGQFTDYYKTFTPTEINNLPLNTMLYEPINLHQEDDSNTDDSGSDSCSTSSSSDSSSSESSDDECNVCSPTSPAAKKVIGMAN